MTTSIQTRRWRSSISRFLSDPRRTRPFLILSALYLLSLTAILFTAGSFTYPLDDTYIHMALGRTLAVFGVWGPGPGSPAAASSSPLWSLLLAGTYIFNVFGIALYIPLILNIVAACTLIFLLLHIFGRRPSAIAFIVAIVFGASLPSLGMLGMEHVLHCLLAIGLCFTACKAIARTQENFQSNEFRFVAILAALAVTARYESLFLVAPLCGLAALRLRWRLALALVLGAALPVLLFGLLWIHNGGWFLPNSLLLKTTMTEHIGLAQRLIDAIKQLFDTLRPGKLGWGFCLMLAALVGLLIWHAQRYQRLWEIPVLFALSAGIATAGHLAFASYGWLYRYETWLIVLDLTAIGLLGKSLLTPRGVAIMASIIVVAFSTRTYTATHQTIESIDDRRLEHIPPAQFVARYYADQTIMVNDLGAIAWFAPDAKVLDIYGLGNNEPVRMRLAPEGYDALALRDWAIKTKTRIAVLQPCWPDVNQRLPPEWTLIATWHVPRNVVFTDHLVGFFAIAPDAAEELRRHLADFPVPKGVTVRLDPTREAMLEGC